MTATDIRPMSLGEILDRTFTLYRKHFWLFVGIMAVPQLIILALAYMQNAVLTTLPGGMTSIVLTVVLTILVLTVTVGGYGLTQAATVYAISEIYLGRSTNIQTSYQKVLRLVMRVIGILLATGLATAAGFVLLIIPGIWVMLRCAIAIPAGVLENRRTIPAINRSIELTKGNAGRIFLLLALFFIVGIVASVLFEMPILFAQMQRQGEPSYWLGVLGSISTSLATILTGPLATIALSLFYFDLRIRKEAFDLQVLMQGLEGRAGATAVPDTP